LVASLIVNLGMAVLTRQHETTQSLDDDEKGYWEIATDFHGSGLAAVPARRTPPFPVLVAGLRWLVGSDYFHVQLALSALLAVGPVLVFWLVLRRFGNVGTAKLASVGFLLWPAFVRYNASLYSDSIGLLVFLCYLLAFPLPAMPGAVDRRRWLQFGVAGALLSCAVQMKPLYLIYLPFALALTLWGEISLRRRSIAALCLVAGCLAAAAPWSAYLSVREGRFIPVSANDGETLAGGLNPALLTMDKKSVFVTSNGRSTWVGPGKWLPMEDTGYLSPEELKLPYVTTSALLTERARAWILSHPLQTAYLSARKLLYMWGLYPFWNGAAQSFFGNFPLLVLISAAIVTLWMARRAWQELALFWSLPLFVSAVSLISWGSWRFRMAGDLGLIVLAALLPALWAERRRRAGGDSPREVISGATVPA
jgi:4-amino-4-deoxy-L-arabinose transferase-like glycosyltransferase